MTDEALPDSFKRFEVTVDLSEVIERDLEGFLDLLSNLATNTELLMDTSWEIIGYGGTTLTLSVIGDISMIDEQEAKDA